MSINPDAMRMELLKTIGMLVSNIAMVDPSTHPVSECQLRFQLRHKIPIFLSGSNPIAHFEPIRHSNNGSCGNLMTSSK
jgi:hypothetical protein